VPYLFGLTTLTSLRFVGIACNTVHIASIFDPLRQMISSSDSVSSAVQLSHIVDLTIDFVIKNYPKETTVFGLLGSTGQHQPQPR
jgi:hypothetical protein